MSSDHDKRWKLLSDLFFGRISEEDFLHEFGATKETIGSVILGMLKQGLDNRQGDVIEEAIPLMYHFGITKDYLGILNVLALEPWHRKHEDIVFALGKLKDPSSVDVLARTAEAKHPYLEDDEAFALGTKSIHALRNIQTPEAMKKLGALARYENEILRKTALRLLTQVAEAGSGSNAEAEARIQLEILQ